MEVINLAQQDFTREILSNGKLSASRKATLWFKNAGMVKSVRVKNGQLIREGSLLAELQPDDFLTSLKRAEAAFERARIDRLNALMAMGYSNHTQPAYLSVTVKLICQGNNWRSKNNYTYFHLFRSKIMKKELEISKKGFQRYEGLLDKGGVSESQVEEAGGRYIQAERGYTNFLASLKSAEISLISLKRSILEVQEQNHKGNRHFRQSLTDSYFILNRTIKEWKEKYLVTSPVAGKLTLTRFWGENHVINAGDRLATVIPEDSTKVICRAIVPSSGIGKVETGQTVHIKLSGYPYMEHGMLIGMISAISLVPEEKGYIVEITLNEGMVSNYRERLKLVQEMEGTAEIITKKIRLIYRFINPLKMVFKK